MVFKGTLQISYRQFCKYMAHGGSTSISVVTSCHRTKARTLCAVFCRFAHCVASLAQVSSQSGRARAMPCFNCCQGFRQVAPKSWLKLAPDDAQWRSTFAQEIAEYRLTPWTDGWLYLFRCHRCAESERKLALALGERKHPTGVVANNRVWSLAVE